MKHLTITLTIVVTLLNWCSFASQAPAEDAVSLKLIDTKLIWDKSPHCAFTDLIRWRDKWYCGFREGEGHAGDRGWLRIVSSTDGSKWETVTKIEHDDFDMRDAALSVTADDKLLVIAGSQQTVNGERSTGTFAAVSEDGKTFSTPQRIFPQGRWLWRVTWQGDTGYGITYSAYDDYPITRLVSTTDGLHYDVLNDSLLNSGWPTEARIRFAEDGSAFCLQRVDRDTPTSLLGKSKAPYTEWTWTDLKQRVGGPNFVQLPSGHWIGCGRLTEEGRSYTVVFELKVDSDEIVPLVRLPSGGDSSYPGMVIHDNQLWISYYSSHEGSTKIYLSRLSF
ncbi:sialidase family protein [Aeoliella mucimassa]|uniref:Sialidase domain-containing protein n=1 Tax=Aeoliella mucimassa TaxID=2527972 RepID=A0A518AQ93_9BACT|nr:sialidase family protein [Aeoliella mucimassa]QDU56889.1 hypothetical protein Pan181_31010 [Aeoliella mucimassa]